MKTILISLSLVCVTVAGFSSMGNRAVGSDCPVSAAPAGSAVMVDAEAFLGLDPATCFDDPTCPMSRMRIRPLDVNGLSGLETSRQV